MCVLTMNYNVCKSAIAFYGLYLSVTKECVCNQLLINPIIRNRTRHLDACNALHVTIFTLTYVNSSEYHSYSYSAEVWL
jgi:hypothetical protein